MERERLSRVFTSIVEEASGRQGTNGQVNYLKKFEERKATNREPLNGEPGNLSSYNG